MVDKVNLYFNYGGEWVLEPTLSYTKRDVHVLSGYEVDHLSYIDLCKEYTEVIGYVEVQQLIFLDPSGRYFLLDGDEGIMKIQSLINDGFTNVQLFGVDLLDDIVNVPVFTQYTSVIDSVPVVVASDCDSTEDDTDIESVDIDYDSDVLGLFERYKKCEVTDNLERYKTLEKGMTFKDLTEANEVIGYYVVSNKRGLKLDKSDKRRLRYKCQIGCPFKYLISKDGKDQGVKIKTWRDEHDCGEVFENRRATPAALARYFKRKIQNNPKFKIKEMKGKENVLEKLEGSYLDEYNKLEAYAQELRETNPGTDVVIQISKDAMEEGKRRFLRMYVSFEALKSGFKAAWAVVDKETKTTWQWFMENLTASLDLKDGEGFRYAEGYVRCCEECEVSEDAVRDLLNYPPVTWCRAYFDTQCKNPMVDNNFTESFNSWILEARHKPIVKMLEDIRVKVMNQLKDRVEEVNSWRGEYNPYAMELYNDYKEMASKCKENFNGDGVFEISEGEDRHTVILEQQRCTCRLWNLFGIPCAHAIRAFLYKKQDPTLGIHWWYSKQAWQLVYQHKLQPVRGKRFWKVEPHQAMDPTPLAKMVGRPKVKRSREKDEARKRQGQWSTSRKGLQMNCSFCGQPNHNKRRCPLANKVFFLSIVYTHNLFFLLTR
ncbi:uncharacterized protein [Nicotiana sylvestris]|uniref:Uncharacterized protein LOC104234862 n=2 Tax=Nicotiana TaxID=4085 RepID=A0A1U7X3X0_NICSY|nr:PREDICTED: uncharacterized protein LOC104234862 [Nicotiana sylvestris]